MTRCFIRLRQLSLAGALRLTEPIVRRRAAHPIEGEGALLRLAVRVYADGVRRVLLVTTAGTVRRGTCAPLVGALERQGIAVTVFDRVVPDPTVACVEQGCAAAAASGCDGVIALGGGSVIDCAKLICARLARPRRTLRQMRGMLRVGRRTLPLYACPTTAGTGSEITAAAVVTDDCEGLPEKYAVSDYCLLPRAAVLDPALTAGLSREMTADTAMDALTHAVEAAAGRYASRYVRRQAAAAVRLIFGALPRACAAARVGADDEVARAALLRASFDAGCAFTCNLVGYVHALAHAVGALCHIPHGRAVGVLLPLVLRAYGDAVNRPLAALARAAGEATPADSDADAAAAFLRGLDRLCARIGYPRSLPGLHPEQYDEILRRARREAVPAYPVPRLLGEEELRVVLAAAAEPTRAAET